MVTSQQPVLWQFSTARKKDGVSVMDPTRRRRKEGRSDRRNKKRQRDERNELVRLQGTDERRMSVVEGPMG